MAQDIVDAVAAKSPDAILIAPTDSQAMFAPIQQASQNSEIVLVDTTLEQPDMPRPANELPQDVPAHMKLMLDLIVLAIAVPVFILISSLPM